MKSSAVLSAISNAAVTCAACALGLALLLGAAACAPSQPASDAPEGAEPTAIVADLTAMAPSEGYPPPSGMDDAAASGEDAMSSAYPPPAGDGAEATETPEADADGYLPAPGPEVVESEVVALEDSPYADLLGDLQAALDAGDAEGLAARVDEAGGGLPVSDVRYLDTSALGPPLDRAGTADLLDAMLANGTAPRVQGYFDEAAYAGNACVNVLVHAFGVPVPYPTANPDAEPFGLIPETIDGNAAAWTFCDDGAGRWLWRAWMYGDYYGTLLPQVGYLGDAAMGYTVVRP